MAYFRSTRKLEAFERSGKQCSIFPNEWFSIEGANSTEFTVRNLSTHLVYEIARGEFERAIERVS